LAFVVETIQSNPGSFNLQDLSASSDPTDAQPAYVDGSAHLQGISKPGALPLSASELAALIAIDSHTGKVTYDTNSFTFLGGGETIVYTIAFEVVSNGQVIELTVPFEVHGTNEAPVEPNDPIIV